MFLGHSLYIALQLILVSANEIDGNLVSWEDNVLEKRRQIYLSAHMLTFNSSSFSLSALSHNANLSFLVLGLIFLFKG